MKRWIGGDRVRILSKTQGISRAACRVGVAETLPARGTRSPTMQMPTDSFSSHEVPCVDHRVITLKFRGLSTSCEHACNDPETEFIKVGREPLQPALLYPVCDRDAADKGKTFVVNAAVRGRRYQATEPKGIRGLGQRALTRTQEVIRDPGNKASGSVHWRNSASPTAHSLRVYGLELGANLRDVGSLTCSRSP